MIKNSIVIMAMAAIWPLAGRGQHSQHSGSLPVINGVAAQPLLAHAARLSEALTFLGSALSQTDKERLKDLQHQSFSERTVTEIQAVLDPYCLAMVNINPEARVKVDRGPATAKLMQGGWTSFLIKVHNEAGVTAPLKAESKNAAPALHMASFPPDPHVKKEHLLTPGQVANRFLEVQMYSNRPLSPNLSGLILEYAVVQIYCKDPGQREADLGFNIGQGTQDIGFRNAINILFHIQPSVKVIFRVEDDDGTPAMASFIISDGIERVIHDSVRVINRSSIDYRFTTAQLEYAEPWHASIDYKIPGRLTGIYPLPSRRVAATDVYPDFFFQPQVYRFDGEHVYLPPGAYTVNFTRGPEYIPQTKRLIVPANIDSMEASFRLKRWIHLAKLGWYSSDHHIHAAGCTHYESPQEGVRPEDIWRQIIGEDLQVGAVLAWGPGWYHQKQFFSGSINTLSTSKNVMRYDVEVSGFPSSHAGHVALLQLKEDDYPGASKIEDWPSWTVPVLQWAKAQGGVTGYAHSGSGLEPMNEVDYFMPFDAKRNFQLPNFTPPRMDGIGANEFVVAVTQDLVDFYSAGNTVAPWELNMWYHTLNCGFRPRLSGETDYPCVYDERVGMARSYFRTDSALSYDGFITAIKAGRSYVSEGGSHLIDFAVNDLAVGTRNSELLLEKTADVVVTAKAAARLTREQQEEGAQIAHRPFDRQPFWHIERARIDKTNKVRVELIVNGVAVDTAVITADGELKDIQFRYRLKKSCWIALRIYPSSHTNPIFVIVDRKPVLVKESAGWCEKAVLQCWKMKESGIRPEERAAAKAAYDKAQRVFQMMKASH